MGPAKVAVGQEEAASADACSAALSTHKPCTGRIPARPASSCAPLALVLYGLPEWIVSLMKFDAASHRLFSSHPYLVVAGGS